MIKRLVKIADNLDRAGLAEDADFVTNLIIAYKKAEVGALDDINLEGATGLPDSIEIPEEELKILREVFTALGDSLGEAPE